MNYVTLVPVTGQFDQVPSILFGSDYADLSMAARLLYSRMLSLTSCSAYHNYQDNRGIYITLSRAGIMSYLDCAQQKATMVVKELVRHDLITLEKDGANKGRIYLKAAKGMFANSSTELFHVPHKPQFLFWKLPRKLSSSLSEGARLLYAYLSDVIRMTKSDAISLIKSSLAQFFQVDRRVVGKWINELTAANLIVKTASPAPSKPIHTVTSHRNSPASISTISTSEGDDQVSTSFADPFRERKTEVVQSINQVDTEPRIDMPVRSEVIPHRSQDDLCSPVIISAEEIRERIDYDYQLHYSPTYANVILDCSVSVLEKLLQGKESVKVGDKIHPGNEVRKILMTFTKRHMTAVLDSFKRYAGLVRNPDGWLKVVMLNAVLEHPEVINPAYSSPRGYITNNLRRSDFSVGSLGARQETPEERKSRFDRLIE